MRSAVLLAIVGAALANPLQKRQDLPIDEYNSLPDLPDRGPPLGRESSAIRSYDATSVAKVAAAAATAAAANGEEAVIVTVVKRADPSPTACITRTFNGPAVTVPTDSAEAFLANSNFAAAANAASAPSGYALAPEFKNLQAAAEDSHYLTYTTEGVTSYDPAVCASKCNAISGCVAFNIFYQRVPLIINPATLVPDVNLCPADVNSPSATLIKCAFYGAFLKKSMAKNVGQYWSTFHIVIAGSNAYVKTSAPVLDGLDGPVSFGNAAINAPAPVNQNGYLRVQTFGQNVPFDPSLCAASCRAQTIYNANHPDIGLGPCIFFNVYVFDKNGENGVLTCTYYSRPYGISYAKNKGQYDAQGNKYSVTNSYGYYVPGNYVE